MTESYLYCSRSPDSRAKVLPSEPTTSHLVCCAPDAPGPLQAPDLRWPTLPVLLTPLDRLPGRLLLKSRPQGSRS